MEIWTKTNNGWCAEISDLQANGNPPAPKQTKCFIPRLAIPHVNFENELTHWTMKLPDGTVLEVFND